MKKVFFVLAFLMLINMSLISAFNADVTVIDDIGSFSGAVLKLRASEDGELGDKIYPSENLANVGIVKFEIETSLSEIYLNIIMTKNGNVVASENIGPYAINGSKILIDRREKVERVVVSEPEVVVNESVEEEIIEVEKIEAEIVEINESSGAEVVDDKPLMDKIDGLFVTGKATFFEDDGSLNLGFSAGGVFFILMFGVFVFMMVKSGRREKKTEDVLSEDDKELAYMNKKVKETEDRISKIKSEKEKKAKLDAAKLKLAKEKKELLELEKEEMKDSETIEDLD